jgi:hypothetical protein
MQRGELEAGGERGRRRGKEEERGKMSGRRVYRRIVSKSSSCSGYRVPMSV